MALQFPPSANTIHQRISDFINQLKNGVLDRQSKLDEISPLVLTPNPLADAAKELTGLREELNTLLFSGDAIGFTPYQYRIGNNNTLSVNAAIEFAAQKLTNEAEPISGQYGLALMITADTESQLASQLQNIIALLPFPEWVNGYHLAAKSTVMSIEKMQIPKPRLNPHWRADDFSINPPLNDTVAYLDAELSITESVAESATNPVDRLKQLADKKNQAMTHLIEDMNRLIATFVGHCVGIKLTGSPQQMAQQLREADISNKAHSALFLLVSNKEPLFFYQMLSVE